MARRPDFPKDEILTEKDLQIIKNQLAMLSRTHVETYYDQAHRECCRHEKGIPPARSI